MSEKLVAIVVLASVLAPQASAQTVLPSVTVTDTAKKPAHKPAAKRLARKAAAGPARASRSTLPTRASQPAAGAPQPAGTSAPDSNGPAVVVPAEVATARASVDAGRAARAQVLPRGPSNSTTLDRARIETLPAGDQTGFDQMLLNLPGVSQDSAGSGDLHIRNEHANVQYRIDGIQLPDGVSGFSQVLDSVFIRSVTLLDGALPAQYGLHTAGIIDIETRSGADAPGGVVSLYGGSHATIIPTLTQSGTTGRWDYFFTGRFTTNNLGIENPEPTHEALHDRTRQGRYFATISGVLEDGSRLSFLSGASIAKYQIPNSPGTPPAFTAFGISDFDSALLNENQVERSIFNVLAWQKSFGTVDTQVAYFQRYSTLHFVPDTIGDLVFNGVASDVTRTSLVNGVQVDNAWRTSARNTVRFGLIGDVERAQAIDSNIVLPTTADGDPLDRPFPLANAERKTGYTIGGYVQDEYYLTPQLAITGGLRYDYVAQYISADQLSPRLGAVYKPTEGTTVHAGYARYFTPPELALSAPNPTGQYDNTTLSSDVSGSGAVRPERSHYFDVGVTQRVLPGLDLGVDGYYKIARNLLDDGQFGQALVLTAFNYDRAYNEGVEFKANYQHGGFTAFGNVAVARQRATQVSSNQYLFDPDELAYIQNHYIATDHDQFVTISGGASYRIVDTTLSTTVLYGSGLRDGFANTGTVSPHAVVNVGLAQDFHLSPRLGPTTLRLTVVNLFDHAYAIRDGSGIGVFQAQYGERRGIFAGCSQRF